ncbi:uncharacterized protein LOC126816944 [Patella vulgata]|uniref:uncharacterized protein LOC126816944 n=1 Tax=Patella vulgata TaxID=6465 RepID=UPI00217FED55|nr:uncharacterized protein LOC126816944 [Patella vulgata]
MSDLLTVATTLPFQSSSNEDVLDFLTEQGKDMENLTATINTTCDIILQSGSSDETNKDEILELCREWNVCMTCITSELETLTQGIISIGSNALPTLREITQGTTAKIKLKLTKEAEVLKELLLMVTQGDATETEKANDLVFDMSHIPEELELDDSPAKIRNADIYKQLTTNIIISKWILKGLQSVRVITSATSDYTVLIDDLLDSTHDTTTQADMKKKINDFQSKMAAIRQKVLQGIVLSPDLNQRAVVRKCLDDITDILPSLVDTIHQSVDDEDERSTSIIWPLKHKIGARLRRIVCTLETMTEVKHKLLQELKKLLDPSSDNSRYQSRTSLSLTPSHLKSPFSTPSSSKKTTPLKVSPSTLSNPKCPRVAGSTLRKKSYGDNDTSYSMQALQPIYDDQDSKSPGQSPYLFKNLRSEQTSTPKDDINNSFDQRRITLDLKSNVNYIERQIERWNENNNPVVMVTVELTHYVTNMVKYCVGEGLIANIEEMIEVAGRVVDCGVKLRDFAVTVANLATDSSHADDLILSTNQITTSSHQLKMIAKVFVSATKNHQTEKILTRNARDLMQGVRDMFELAEIMCIKGLSLTGEKTREEMDALALLKSWQRRLLEQRHEELNSTELDELGLRRVEEHNPPRLTHLLDNGYYI